MDEKKLAGIWPEWTVEKEIGQGGFGVVYKAVRQDNGFKSYAAIKKITIPQNLSEIDSLRSEGLDENASRTYLKNVVDEFVTEIQVMEKFKGIQNIVSVEDYKVIEKTDEIGWDIYIRMELLTPFNSYICDKKLTEQDVIQLGCDICTALEICNQKNIIHRDIKPENIFVNEYGYFKLGDFGISRKLENHSMAASKKGTPNYMAPEVYKAEKYDSRVDIYSLGIVLYRLLNGNRFPFWKTEQMLNPNERQDSLNRRINGEVLPAPSEASPAMANLILKACAHNPENRFSSATEMKQALLEVKAGTYQMEDLSFNKTISTGDRVQNIEQTRGKQNKKHIFGGFRRKTRRRIAVAVVAALLIGGGAIIVPRIMDSFSEEASQNRNGFREENQDASVTNSPTEGTKAPEKNADDETMADANETGKNEKQTADYSKVDREKIASILEEAEQLAEIEDYEGAVGKIQAGLVVYPKSADLQDKLEQYGEQLAAKVKEETLNAAADYALDGDYLAAMVVIEEAQKEAPEDAEYQEAHKKYAVAYEDKVVSDALQNADKLADSENYDEALDVLSQAKKEFADNEKLGQKYEEVNNKYTEKLNAEKKQKILDEAASFANKGEYVQAIEVIEKAQKEMPEDADYQTMHEQYKTDYRNSRREAALSKAEELANNNDNLSAMQTIEAAIQEIGEEESLGSAADKYKTAYVTGVVNQSNEYVVAGSYEDAMTVVEEALINIPGNAMLIEQKANVEKQKPKFFLEECPPYEGNYKEYSGNEVFYMGGEAYTNGFACDSYHPVILSNLKNKYEILEFDIGHVDNSPMSAVDVSIYLDGELYKKIAVNPEALPEHIIISLSNKRQIKFEFGMYGAHGMIGLANMTIK